MIEKTIIVSDIHGCLREFEELLNIINYDPKIHRLILLGDLIDRGEFSVETVQLARQMDLECVMGNHEHKFLKWYNSKNSKADVYDKRDFYNKFSDEDIDYIFKMPPYIKIDNFIIVHAGVKSGIDISMQSKNDLLYMRYTDIDKHFISSKTVAKYGKKESGAYFWTEFWTGPASIVYGHNVHSFSEPLIEETCPGVFCYGLDTGCCFGGFLTAMILETKEIVQVKAKKVYYESRLDL